MVILLIVVVGIIGAGLGRGCRLGALGAARGSSDLNLSGHEERNRGPISGSSSGEIE